MQVDLADSKLIMLFLVMTLLTVIFVFFLIAAMIRLKNRQVRREEELLRALIAERERTMTFISSEIHDNTNQVLSLARMSLSMISKTALAEQRKYVDECGNILDIVIADLRNMSHSLNSDYLKKQGLIESLQQEIKWINLSKNIESSLDVIGYNYPLKPETELMLMRIAQEAIQNTIKHSNASTMVIKLNYEASNFEMEIIDDGIGFEMQQQDQTKGLGLQSIQQRSKSLGATIEIFSSKHLGTRIKLKMAKPSKVK